MGRLIDADELTKEFEWLESQANDKDRVQDAMQRIKKAPTVDAEEVVRCGKCEELHREWYCGLSGMPVDEDDFCSFGKEKR